MRQLGFADLARLRVLVIDDDPRFHKVFRTILQAVGVSDARFVVNTVDGLREMSDSPPDVIFVD